ncbi:MoaD/ThiS family protein [Pseudoalteromonas sp. S4741]|uniref:MoaD/ThiS family protein n=1 Tax=Pseudoalteromonas sp. S4741 TaxID=579563 RepID=UPI00110AFF9D|nr:MoaD/ThiS family protein [Pseudoalteromonas sp. S4741]TMO28192.1 molybdopterin synthase sulfur carrier subunit [Pseudoalteromonas sp. S4741]
MIKVKFFGQLRELLACNERLVDVAHIAVVNDLLTVLSQENEKWAMHLAADNILVAVNHEMSTKAHALKAGDEVALFPPVTGG